MLPQKQLPIQIQHPCALHHLGAAEPKVPATGIRLIHLVEHGEGGPAILRRLPYRDLTDAAAAAAAKPMTYCTDMAGECTA
ncbi:hypothetical protein CH063_08858 [Colletotrichum higginsianum]|nr:hypothetical protein CH063_08858 [Colletotrichum higginsianum]